MCLLNVPTLLADPTFHIDRGARWSYFLGLQEASAPVEAWRGAGFGDTGWASGLAPFGYGDPPFATDLGGLDPPMRSTYSTLFLRTSFEVTDAGAVAQLQVNVDYDDGFVLWINGMEVLRVNVPAGALAFDGFAAGNHESGTYENFTLPDPDGYLVSGVNVVAVQGFNVNLTSSDFKFDMDIVDPFGPDLTPPTVVSLVPAPGTTVRSLGQIEVRFSEEVSGVEAADLVVDGAAAASVRGAGAGPYVFRFAELPPGAVDVLWVADHGIADFSEFSNPFGGGAWSYTVDPDAPEVDLVLNEVVAVNRSGRRDGDGERSDWFEVYNRGSVAADLTGVSVTDDPEEPGKWTFPSVTIGPRRYLVVVASGKDRKPLVGELHTNFKLSSSGEYLGLYSATSPRRVLSEFAPRYPEQRPDFSYGVDRLGGAAYFDPPTPGADNGNAVSIAGLTLEPVFSRPRGFTSQTFRLELVNRTPGATIYYTLDGSEPGPGSGLTYGGPIDVAPAGGRGGVTVRAVAFRDGWLPSNVVTSSYIFLDEVLAQSNNPTGFPRRWGAAPAVDYEMDPQVIGSERTAVREGLLSIPTMSIVMNTAGMFGSNGIYSNPGGSGISWERASSVELIYPDGRRGFQVNCGIRIHGGASRNPSKSPKHGLRLLFKGAYGPTKLNFPLFEGSPVDRFDTLVLRSNYNNSWIHWDNGQRRRGTMIRDQFARDSQLAMGGPSPHGTYVNVYLNGLYWGVYNVTERPSAPFAAAHLGGEKEEYDALNSGELIDGNRTAWNSMMGIVNGGLGSNARYLQLAEVLDLPHFIDYMIMNFYGSNADWPSHNWYAARRRIPGGQFQFYSWDAERILEDRNSNRTGVSNGDSPGVVYSRLRANDEFRLLFADRAHRHLFGAGALTPRAVAARWTARKNELFTAVTAESARWGDYRRDVHRSSNGPYEFYRRSTHWFPEHDRLEKSYFPARTRVLLGQLRSNGLYPAVGAPEMNRTGGEVTPGFTLVLRLPRGTSGQIYVTLDGTDPRVFGTGGDVSPGAMEYVDPLVLNDLAHVKARTLSGGTWSALAEALFTVVGPRDALRVTEIMYNPPEGPTHEFLELRNTASVTVGLGGLRFSKGLNYTFPEGASLGPGEFWVLGSDEAAFASKYPGVGLDGVYLGSLANGGERLTIADGKAGGMAGGDGESVLTLVYDDEDFWPLGADGLGWSLVLGSEDAPASEPESWRASAARGGSPGAEDGAPVASGVWINEVLTGSTAPLEDAVELFNAGSRPADVGGWYLSDSRLTEERLKKYRIPSGTVIPSGGYLVIYEAEFNSDPGSPASFALDRGGDDVYLSSSDPAGELTGYVVGHDFGAAEDGVSLGRVETSVGPDFAALRERTFGVDEPGTVEEFRMGRGVANALPLVGEVVLNELHYNPAAGVEFVELHNRSGEVVSLYDEALGRGWRLTGVRNPEGTDDYEFEVTAEVAPGGYLLVVPVDPQLFRSLRVVPAEVPVAGPFRGRLDNGGESIRLRRPVEEDGQVVYVSVDRVRYDDDPPWPSSADGGGPSLERVEASGYGNEPQNWDASAAPGGTPGVQNSVSRPGENQRPRASFVARGGAGPLEAEFDASASRDKDGVITSFVWDFGDGDGGSGEVVRHLYASPGVYTVRLEVTDDLGARSSAVRSVEVADDPGGGRQVPADANQDGSLDISDAITLLQFLFLGGGRSFPCGDVIAEGGNRILLDTNGDGGVDLSDAVSALSYLFQGGPAPALGTTCTPIAGCPDVCGI